MTIPEIRDGAEVFGSDGHKIGTVGQVFELEGSGEPTWIAVQTGLFGMHETFAPVEGATMRGDELVLAHDKSFVKDAPRIAGSDDLTVEQEAELYRYYGIKPPLRRDADAHVDRRTASAAVDDLPHDERGNQGERLRPESEGAGQAAAAAAPGGPRLRRRVVTEMQTVQVPVQREEIVVEGDGIDPDAPRAR